MALIEREFNDTEKVFEYIVRPAFIVGKFVVVILWIAL